MGNDKKSLCASHAPQCHLVEVLPSSNTSKMNSILQVALFREFCSMPFLAVWEELFHLSFPEHSGHASVASGMNRLLLALLLLAVSYSVCALSSNEITALEDLVKNFPLLREQRSPWSRNASLACESPVFYGLTCTDGPDQHVSTLYEPKLRTDRNIVPSCPSCPHFSSGLTNTACNFLSA